MFPSLLGSIDYCLIASIESGGDISQLGRGGRETQTQTEREIYRERNIRMGV